MRKPKPEVKYWRAKMSATARCMKGLDDDGYPIESEEVCGWTYPGYFYIAPDDAETRREAKKHAQLKPGHVVRVIQRDVADYWCETEEAEASAPLPPNDVPTP